MDSDFSRQLSIIGVRIYMGGIALQEVFILGFLVLLILFRNKTRRGEADVERNDGWRYLNPALLAVVTLISVHFPHTLSHHTCSMALYTDLVPIGSRNIPYH